MEGYYSKPDLKNRGWTESLIRDYLPESSITRDNPFYKSGGKMKFWMIEIVAEAEKNPEFQSALAKSAKRKKSASKAVQTKKQNNLEYVDLLIDDISVTRIPMDDLLQKTIQYKNARYSDIGQWDMGVTENTDPEVLQRMEVNFIRHNLTQYEEDLYDIKGSTGINEMYIKYKKAVLHKIAEVYPELADECHKQEPILETDKQMTEV